MDALVELFDSLINVFWSLLDVIAALVKIILPWLPLLAWIAFWSLAVNWTRAFDVMRKGGFLGVLLLMYAAVMIWAAVAPPVDGNHVLFGLTVGNYAGKFIYVTMLTCIAFLCGSVQMSGTFGSLCNFESEADPTDQQAAAHAH